jgi:predicted MPP superfamily phosphohydrolase
MARESILKRWLLNVRVRSHFGGPPSLIRLLYSYRLIVERVCVPLPDLPPAMDGFKIGLMSDFHRGIYVSERHIRRAAEKMMEQSPDIIILGGDYVYPRADFAESCARALSILQAPLGVYFVLGNHDYWTDANHIERTLQNAGFIGLKNRAVRLVYRDCPLYLVGLDSATEGSPDPAFALSSVPEGAFLILAVHEPDYAETLKSRRIPLQVSGHSYGGQVIIPWFGPPVLPRMGVLYPMGLQKVRDSENLVYTTRGIGMGGLPIRLFCPPEVSLLILRR